MVSKIDFKFDFACQYARAKHRNQVRKYTGEPYFNHVYEVAMLVKGVVDDEDMHCAAVLHDVIEDTGTPWQEVHDLFGSRVCELVEWMTDVSRPWHGNRDARKKIDLEHTMRAPADAKTIKLADFLSNMENLVELDPKFAKVYAKEKRALLPYLMDGNKELYVQASALLQQVEDKLRIT